ncbi:ankyrin repeat-containing domain protein [Coprinopsis sp. MPI-PUGE-AT-0042]|nr:ankyrin repeat-containing domain protein [Coprinopsis sp. MPI-PUGE-AT-0042]
MVSSDAPHPAGYTLGGGATFMPGLQNAQFTGGTLSNVGHDQHVTVHNSNHNTSNYHYYQQGQAPGPPAATGSSTALDIIAILASLALPNFWKLQADIFARVTQGTGLWLAKGAVLEDWLKKGKILWGVGIPGAGKTFLFSIVIDHLSRVVEESTNNNRGTCLAYVYIRYSEPLSIQQILESLVKQIVQSHPESTTHLLQAVYKKHHREKTQPTVHELCSILSSLCRAFETCVVGIDGVDEMPSSDQRVLVRMLASAMELDKENENSNGRLFLTSRPLPGVQRNFPEAVVVDVMAQGHDIEVHLREVIRRTPGLDDLFYEDPSFEQEVIGIIKDRCGGMFLHADLQLQALHQCLSIQDARDTLSQFPERIDDIYLRTWERISDSQPPKHTALARLVLLWVVFATREMTIDELRRAVAAAQNPKGHTFEAARMVPEASMTSACCGLITVDERTRVVRLIHFTAKDTLEPLLLQLFPEPQGLLLSICLTHLTNRNFHKASFMSVGQLDAAPAEDPLLNYAYTSWDHHAHNCYDRVESASSQVTQFIQQCESYPVNYFNARYDCFGPAHVAAHMGLTKVFATFTEELMDPNIKTAFGRATPLFLASKRGHEEIVYLLLAHPDTDVNAQNHDGDTALVGACAEGQEAPVRLLLAHPKVDVNIPANDGTTAIINAGGRGFDALVDHLLKHPQTDVNHAKKDCWTALMYAAQNNHISTTKLLLKFPKLDMNMRLADGGTALIIAALLGHVEIVDLLLSNPATDPNLTLLNGFTALLYAAWSGHGSVVKTLLRHPKTAVNVADDVGDTALIDAVKPFGDGLDTIGIVEDLLAHPDIDPNVASKNGSTALTAATEDRCRDAVKLLLGHPKTDVNLPGRDGKTALGIAASRDDTETVELLLQHPNINVNSTYPPRGDTALISACAEDQEDIVRLLVQRHDIDVNIAADDGTTAIINAGGRGFERLVRLLLTHRPEVNVNAAKKDGWTAVMYAAFFSHVSSLQLLLQHGGVDPNLARHEDGATALFLAADNGDEGPIGMLLEHPQIDVNKATDEGMTPLMVASLNGQVGVVKRLLEHRGIEVNRVDGRGATALFLACENGQKEVVQVLLGAPGIDVGVMTGDGKKAEDVANGEVLEILLNVSLQG